MRASDFRAAARSALSGKWIPAVIAGLIASILGGASASGVNLELKFEEEVATLQVGAFPIQLSPAVLAALSYTVVAILIMALVLYVLGSVINLGYARFNLTLIEGGSPEIGTLFSYFPHFKTAFCARFLTGLYAFLWGLLLIFPGIYASYGYAMTPYILAENPDLTAREAISRSKQLMHKHRLELFMLDVSFFGWMMVSVLTLGIGDLFLTPYTQAARAAFYRNLLYPQPDPLLMDL